MIYLNSLEEIRAKAAALRELRIYEAFLERGAPDMPWDLATSYEPGGLHRFDCCVSGWFRFVDPVSKMKISWAFDLEPLGANGASSLRFDIESIRKVSKLLRGPALLQFHNHLRECVTKIRVHGDEWAKSAAKQFADAYSLEAIFTEAA
jgi:hypothetical protein